MTGKQIPSLKNVLLVKIVGGHKHKYLQERVKECYQAARVHAQQYLQSQRDQDQEQATLF